MPETVTLGKYYWKVLFHAIKKYRKPIYREGRKNEADGAKQR